MKRLLLIGSLFITSLSCTTTAQFRSYDNDEYATARDDRYYYEERFDWHWDVRVRISEGINNGLITNREANRLYRDLEDIEQLEYRYFADGRVSNWEMDRLWSEVTDLHRRIGFELRDADRRFYGFDSRLYVQNAFPFWFDRRGYDFNRFDNRGWGNTRNGYSNRHYRPGGHNDITWNDRNRRDNNRDWDRNRRGNDSRDDNNRNNNGRNDNRGGNNRDADGRRGNDRRDTDSNNRSRDNEGRRNAPSNDRGSRSNDANRSERPRTEKPSRNETMRFEAPERRELETPAEKTPRSRNERNTNENRRSESSGRSSATRTEPPADNGDFKRRDVERSRPSSNERSRSNERSGSSSENKSERKSEGNRESGRGATRRGPTDNE